MNINELVNNQKNFLLNYLQPKIQELTATLHIDNIDTLDTEIFEFTQKNDFINLSYVLDKNFYQISSNITTRHIKTEFRNQDLSARPFLADFSLENSCYLTDSYISFANLKPCISLVYGILKQDDIQAILVLDLDLIKLPLLISHFALEKNVEQLKGDKAIRSSLFNQERKTSRFDENINKVHQIAHKLLTEFGVFHIKLHYSASRATIWQYDDPYNYLVLSVDELLSDNIYLLFPAKVYPQQATVPKTQIKTLLDNFKYLRFMDENMYLRAGSVNIINQTIGVNFSCDGYHYLTANEFLNNFDKLYS
jgi:hypothetical protein